MNFTQFFLLKLFIALPLLAQEAAPTVIVAPTQAVSACASSSDKTTIKFMTYNVENLFNAEHEEGTNDFEYLPTDHPLKKAGCEAGSKYPDRVAKCIKTNWTQSNYEAKINQITQLINNMGEQKPDVLSLVEVEGESVTQDLANKLGYTKILLNNDNDERGIQAALLINENSGIEFINSTSHEVTSVSTKDPTKIYKERDILEVQLSVNKKLVSVLVSHWAASMSPTAARASSAKKMSEISQNAMADGRSVISMGDFNSDGSESPNPFSALFKSGLMNLHEKYLALKPDRNLMPLGTYFFPPDMRWQVIDQVFFKSIDIENFEVNAKSYKIISSPAYVRDWVYDRGYNMGSLVKNIPKKFNVVTGEGASDHFPVYFEACIVKAPAEVPVPVKTLNTEK